MHPRLDGVGPHLVAERRRLGIDLGGVRAPAQLLGEHPHPRQRRAQGRGAQLERGAPRGEPGHHVLTALRRAGGVEPLHRQPGVLRARLLVLEAQPQAPAATDALEVRARQRQREVARVVLHLGVAERRRRVDHDQVNGAESRGLGRTGHAAADPALARGGERDRGGRHADHAALAVAELDRDPRAGPALAARRERDVPGLLGPGRTLDVQPRDLHAGEVEIAAPLDADPVDLLHQPGRRAGHAAGRLLGEGLGGLGRGGRGDRVCGFGGRRLRSGATAPGHGQRERPGGAQA